jgi:predicted DNA-binding antitoxin AbrB/MazE fold protein
MTKTKTVDVVYEDGVFKPLEKVELELGKEITIKVIKIQSDIQTAKSILSMLDSLPIRKVDLKLAEELYHEGRTNS